MENLAEISVLGLLVLPELVFHPSVRVGSVHCLFASRIKQTEPPYVACHPAPTPLTDKSKVSHSKAGGQLCTPERQPPYHHFQLVGHV